MEKTSSKGSENGSMWTCIYFNFIFGSAFAPELDFGAIGMVANLMLLLQVRDFVWKYENTVKTEQRDLLLLTLFPQQSNNASPHWQRRSPGVSGHQR